MGFLDDFFDMLDGTSEFLNSLSMSYTIGTLRGLKGIFQYLINCIDEFPNNWNYVAHSDIEELLDRMSVLKSSIDALDMDSIKMYNHMLRIINDYTDDYFIELNISTLNGYKELLDADFDDITKESIDYFMLSTSCIQAEIAQYISCLNVVCNNFDYYNDIYQEHQYD